MCVCKGGVWGYTLIEKEIVGEEGEERRRSRKWSNKRWRRRRELTS
jgi:hypothetical protein